VPPASWNRRSTSPIAITLILGCVLLVTGLLMRIGGSATSRADSRISVSVTACSATDTSPPMAQVLYTVSNRGVAVHDARLRIEYRDASGNRLGTDLSRVESVAGGGTVLSGKTTILRSPSRSMRCRITVID
jgi:hypothetical protein